MSRHRTSAGNIDGLQTWANIVLAAHAEGLLPRWEHEVTAARFILLGIITSPMELMDKRGRLMTYGKEDDDTPPIRR